MVELSKIVTIKMDEKQINDVVAVDLIKIKADKLIVSTQIEYEVAADAIGDISSRITHIDAMRRKIKSPILEAGRNVDDMFRMPLNQARQAKDVIKEKMLHYVEQVEIEKRLADEKTANEALKNKSASEKEAMEAMEDGDDDKAQSILDNIDMTPTPVNIVHSASAAGISTRANWKAKLTDLHKVLKAVIDNKAPITLIMLDNSAANKYAKAVRDTQKIPGIEFYNDTTIAVKTRNRNDPKTYRQS